jgi:small subunit ribosomal protein S16
MNEEDGFMAVVIRLRRMGAKKDPKFRIVVAESKAPRDGRFVEEIGSYNAQPKEAELRVNADRASYWLSVGATPSDQVRSLFKKAGVALPVRATRPKKKAEARPAKAAAKKGPSKRAQAKKARAAAKATTPRKKAATKKAAKKAGKK